MVTPGQEYTITVNKWSIKNIESRVEVEKVIIPPMKPNEAEAIALDSTNIYLKFAPPTEGDFDKFIISFESAYSRASFEYSTLDRHPGSKFYHEMLNNLRPGSHYRIKIYTVSHGVKSATPITRMCTTLSPSEDVLGRQLVLTGEQGLCTFNLDGLEDSFDSERDCGSRYLKHHTKGSVSAVFHEIWDAGRQMTHTYIIHANPKDKNIKITPLELRTHTSQVVVDQLDMPLGI